MENFMGRAALLHSRQFGSWTAGAAEILRSELTPEGAIHTVVCACPLAGQ
jgi:2'-5' RNA ligase